jgi:hypothetical protein
MCRKLVCRHEPLLSNTTDADEKFPDRRTSYTIDGEVFEGVFSVDLTLAEIKTLRARQSNNQRDSQYDGQFEVRCPCSQHSTAWLSYICTPQSPVLWWPAGHNTVHGTFSSFVLNFALKSGSM